VPRVAAWKNSVKSISVGAVMRGEGRLGLLRANLALWLYWMAESHTGQVKYGPTLNLFPIQAQGA